MRPNRDLGQLRLAGALSLCGQFLDGTLDAIFVNDSKKSWLVDPDLLLVKERTLWLPSIPILAMRKKHVSSICMGI